ncbi:ESX secretion-associated protein EspG [Actinomycetes bacterium M1A6_2h]
MVKDGLISVDTPIDVHLDDDEMACVMDSLGIDELPGVLNWQPSHHSESQRRQALARVVPELVARGVMTGNAVNPAVALCIQRLARTSWDLEVRTVTRSVTGVDVGRVCLSANAGGRVLAIRTPTTYEFRSTEAGSIVPLPDVQPLQFCGVSAPRESMVRALDRPTRAAWLSLGCDENTGAILSAALSANSIHTEIVLVGHRGAVPERIGTPVALFDTPHGRILATTSFAVDGTAWSSLAPGTATRLRDEIESLINAF